jgi:prevent-host-death family protein
MIASAKELRFHTREILESTMRGEEVVVTYRGKPAARIIPFTKRREKKESNVSRRKLFGIWKDRNDVENVNEYVRKLRQSRIP